MTSSPAGPYGSEFSGWWQTFSFLCQSSGKESCTDVSFVWPVSTGTKKQKIFEEQNITLSPQAFQYRQVESCKYKSPQTITLWGATAPCTLLASSVSRDGLLYTLSTSSGAVLRCSARSNDCTEKKKHWHFETSQVTTKNTRKRKRTFKHH